MALITDACVSARAGRGRLIVVRGAAGIGKTTLCEQAAERAERAGFTVGWGRCWSDGGAPPLWPWPAVLTEIGGADAARLLAEDAGRPGLDRDRFARFMAIGELLAERARATPLMVVIDDAHVADTAALLLNRFLVRALDRRPFVMLMTRRPADNLRRPDSATLLDELEREATPVHLESFDRHDIAAYLSAHGVAVEDYGLVPAIARLTSGNPLLLARAVAHTLPGNALAGVEHVIGDALGVLSPEHRDVVALAAILGMDASTADIAALARCDSEDVHEALVRASSAGLMDHGPPGWSFTHELVRRAALAVLTPAEVMGAHARAVTLAPSDDRTVAVARRAHHALAAAARSDADASRAVGQCRDAARVLSAGFDYEAAAGLLDSAVELVERLTPPVEHVDVLLEWADALQVCGRLADARIAYERAAAAAESAADPLARARAALGLGGVWVNEHRGHADRERVLGLQRSARDALPADAAGLRSRLTVRLAAEAVYDDAPIEPVLDALAAARQVGDPRVLAEALSLSHHAMLAPEHLEDRMPIAEELIDVASSAGDSLRVLFGLLWKGVDQFHAGDIGATRTLAELRQRADAVGCRSIAYIVAAIDVMRLIREGRLDAAEAAADECVTIGVDVGDADATGYYGVHLLTIRWLQERDAELIDLARDIATSSTLVTPEFAFRAGAAMIAARAGLTDEAAEALRALRGDGLDTLPRSSTWLAGMVIVAEAAYALGDAELAREVYPLLQPFASRPAMPSLAVSCFGSVERALGLAALTWDDAELAVHHLEHAVRRNTSLGNRPFAAISRADLAVALEGRRQPGDCTAAAGALQRAATDAEQLGMESRAAAWRARAADVTAAERDTAALRRDGARWVVDVDDRHVVVPDLVGLGYIGRLVTHPGAEIPAVELCDGATIEGATHDLIDPETVTHYRRRVREIDDRLGAARGAGSAGEVARLQHERDELRAQLSGALALSGRSRRFVDSGERARTAVRKAITRAIDVIAASDDQIGAELRATITTGRSCCYIPDPARPRRWSVVDA